MLPAGDVTDISGPSRGFDWLGASGIGILNESDEVRLDKQGTVYQYQSGVTKPC